MRYVEIGGLRTSVVGVGTWQFGSREWGYGADYAEREAGAIVERALELGITLFDTAEIYGRGRSERILGAALAGRRDQAVIATKYAPFVPTPTALVSHARASARRLGTEQLDLYQLHWPNPISPLGPIPGFARAQRDGLVAHAGVSNFSLERWQAAERTLGGPIVSNQVEYNLVQRAPEREMLAWAQANDRMVIAYSPLAQGAFSGRWSATNRPGGVRRLKPLFTEANMRKAEDLAATVRAIADAHGATPSQVALAWLLRRPNVVVIPGASSVAQLESNAAAADLELTDEDDTRLVAASDAFRPTKGLAAVPDLAAGLLPGRR